MDGADYSGVNDVTVGRGRHAAAVQGKGATMHRAFTISTSRFHNTL
jgi:hypothetical protein